MDVGYDVAVAPGGINGVQVHYQPSCNGNTFIVAFLRLGEEFRHAEGWRLKFTDAVCPSRGGATVELDFCEANWPEPATTDMQATVSYYHEPTTCMCNSNANFGGQDYRGLMNRTKYANNTAHQSAHLGYDSALDTMAYRSAYLGYDSSPVRPP